MGNRPNHIGPILPSYPAQLPSLPGLIGQNQHKHTACKSLIGLILILRPVGDYSCFLRKMSLFTIQSRLHGTMLARHIQWKLFFEGSSTLELRNQMIRAMKLRFFLQHTFRSPVMQWGIRSFIQILMQAVKMAKLHSVNWLMYSLMVSLLTAHPICRRDYTCSNTCKPKSKQKRWLPTLMDTV